MPTIPLRKALQLSGHTRHNGGQQGLPEVARQPPEGVQPGHEAMGGVAPEELIGAKAAQCHLDALGGHRATDQVSVEGVGGGAIEDGEPLLHPLKSIIFSNHELMVAGSAVIRHAPRLRTLVKREAGESHRERLNASGLHSVGQRGKDAGIQARGEETRHRHIGQKVLGHGFLQFMAQGGRGLPERLDGQWRPIGCVLGGPEPLGYLLGVGVDGHRHPNRQAHDPRGLREWSVSRGLVVTKGQELGDRLPIQPMARGERSSFRCEAKHSIRPADIEGLDS
jgi:hypothetical protein